MPVDQAELDTEQVLRKDIPWETYMTMELITGTSLQLLKRRNKKSKSYREQFLDDVLRDLIAVLDKLDDSRELVVASLISHSSFSSQYHIPSAQIIVTDLKPKGRVMKLMNHEDAEVTKNALLPFRGSS